MNRFIIITLLFLSVILMQDLQVNALTVTPDVPVYLQAETNSANIDIVIKDNFVKSKLISAENRFLQGNVKASHDDFEDVVNKALHDDYVFLSYGIKMAEFGYFDLSEELIKKLDNNLYTKNYVKDIRNFYYPSGMLNAKDTLYLADAYAGIVYNNLAMETTSELLNSVQANESDYKNYLVALGYYKSNNLPLALKYINKAETQNDFNINYKVLKAKILADSGKSKAALKVLDKIKKAQFYTVDFQNKVKAIEEYVLYKTAKDEALKDYHLSYYYHLQGKSLLATKVLQAAIIQSKSYAPQIFALLARIYYENDESAKAFDFAQRAYKDNNKNYLAVLTLADINYDDRRFDDAMKYYKIAKKLTKDLAPSIGIAKTLMATEQDTKSKKMYEKILKKNSSDEDLLMAALKVFPQRSYDYIPAIVSVDLANNDAWLELANLSIKDGNLKMAETYLNNSYYIDENNFKYYYYLSQVLDKKGDIVKANWSLDRCSKLNSDYQDKIYNTRQRVYEK